MTKCWRLWTTQRRQRCTITNDELHTYLKGSAYTYKFSCSADHEDAQYIVEGNKIAFRDLEKQKDYYLNLVHVEKDEYEVRAECYGLLFELLNEDVGAYAPSQAMTFAQYYAAFDPEGSTTLGLNEVSDKVHQKTNGPVPKPC